MNYPPMRNKVIVPVQSQLGQDFFWLIWDSEPVTTLLPTPRV